MFFLLLSLPVLFLEMRSTNMYTCKTSNSWAPYFHIVLEGEDILLSTDNKNTEEYYNMYSAYFQMALG